jgi:hypothetical protein
LLTQDSGIEPLEDTSFIKLSDISPDFSIVGAEKTNWRRSEGWRIARVSADQNSAFEPDPDEELKAAAPKRLA